MKPTFYFFLLLIVVSCNGSSLSEKPAEADGVAITDQQQSSATGIEGYTLSEPDQVFVLPGELEEISGLQYIGNGLVATIQDEKGTLFLFDIEQGKLSAEINWGEDGDYEGIAGDATTLYVLESKGDLYTISNFSGGEKPKVQKRETSLPKGCDAEGLFLLEDKGWLLIACKEGNKGKRSVWAYDLQKAALQEEPYLQIPQELLEQQLVRGGLDRVSLGLKKILDAKGESGVLSPSGIARHPLTQDLYILSAKTKLLVTFSPSGELKQVAELENSLFQQAESITFTPSGDMLIGNEANGGEPNILKFKYEK